MFLAVRAGLYAYGFRDIFFFAIVLEFLFPALRECTLESTSKNVKVIGANLFALDHYNAG